MKKKIYMCLIIALLVTNSVSAKSNKQVSTWNLPLDEEIDEILIEFSKDEIKWVEVDDIKKENIYITEIKHSKKNSTWNVIIYATKEIIKMYK